MDRLEFNNENARLGIKDFSPSEILNIGGQKTAVEWLWRWQMDNEFASFKEGVDAYKKAKAMEKEQMEKCYNHGSLSLLDTGNGDSFEEYYNETYKN
jgi:hypothetical protein